MLTVWNKLDPGLSFMYANYLQVRQHGPDAVARLHPVVPEGGRLTSSLTYIVNLADAEALGFRTLTHEAAGLATMAIDLENVDRLDAHAGVQKVPFGRARTPCPGKA